MARESNPMPEGTIWLATSGRPTPGITILSQRKAEGTIPMRVTAPPVFETGAVPLTALPSLR